MARNDLEFGPFAERMAALAQAQRVLASTDDSPEALMDRIPELVLGVLPATGAAFELVDGDAVVIRSGSAAAAAALGVRVALAGSLSGEAIRLGRTLRCDETLDDPRVDAEACRRFGLRSVLATVVRDRAGPIGILKLFDSAPGRFGAAEGDALELLAEALGAVIQRKRAEQDVQRALRIQEGIVGLQQQVAESRGGIAEVLQLIVERTRELTEADGASIGSIDGGDLVYRAGCGIALRAPGFREPGHGNLARRSIDLGEILVCDDAETDRRVDRALCREAGLRSLVAAPVRTAGDDVGVIRVMARRTGAFGPLAVGTLRILAQWLGVVLQRAADAERLRESEAQYRLMFAGHPLPMWVYDIETFRFLAVNDSAIAQYGYSQAEFLALSLPDLRVSEGALFLGRALEALRSEPRATGFSEHRRKDGSILQVEVSISAIAFGGRPARLALVQDVTEKIQAERRIARREALLSIGSRAARVGGWSLELPSRRLVRSDEVCAMFEQPADVDLSAEQAMDVYLPESRARLEAAIVRARVEGTPYDLELEATTASGRRIWVRMIGQEVNDSQGRIIAAAGAIQDITERKLAEQGARVLAANLSATLDSISHAFCTVDRDWRFTYLNAEALRMLDATGTGLVGQVVWQALPRWTGTAMERLCREAAETGRAVTFETDDETRGIRVEVHAYPSEIGLAVHLSDVSERHGAQQALRAMNETLEAKVAARTAELERSHLALAGKEEEIRSVVEHMADGVITFGDDGTIRSANSKIEAMFGHPAAALVGRPVALLMPMLVSLGEGVAADAAVAAVGRETSGLHRDGGQIVLDAAFSDYRIQGQRLWTAILRDIGERVRIMAALEQARRGAEAASKAKSEFVATMSHEIRTPMNGVIGMMEVLHQTPLAPEQSRMLGVARDSAHALLVIIEDILDFSKIEAGRIEIERVPISVADVVGKVGELVLGMAAGKQVAWSWRADDGLDAAVWGDAGRLRQVLINLVGNAIKFSAGRPDAAVSLAARLAGRRRDAVDIELEVVDNGIGMDPATVDRLFLPFSQADASTTRRFGGTGLGLAITRHLVELMGGTIEVRSRLGIGSTFTVRVTCLRVDAMALAPADATAPSAPVASWSPGGGAAPEATRTIVDGGLVLVAEDNEINQEVITEQLQQLGFRATVVPHGRAALEHWRTGRYAVLLTDLQMPEMDGYELVAAIRQEEGGGARLPIIALTANARTEEATRCEAAGMDGYLTKPLRMSLLGETLKAWVRPDARAAGADLPTP